MINANLVKELREKSGAGMMDCKKALEECAGDLDQAIDWLREKGIASAGKKEARIAAEGLSNVYVSGDKAVIVELNSETDFVSKNEEFKSLLNTIGNTILESDVKTLEEALTLSCEEGTINDLIISKTAKIGEKLALRRFDLVTKKANEVFGTYLHMGGKISALTILSGASEEIAKDIAMQAAAMKPQYLFETDVPADVVAHEKEVLKKEAMEEGKPADIAEKMVAGRLKKYFQEIVLVHQNFIKDSDIDVATYLQNHNGEIINMIRYEVGEGMEKRTDNFAEEVMNQINVEK